MAQEEVTRLPLRRICSECDHSAIGPYGVHCLEFREDIWNEEVAQECPQYTPQTNLSTIVEMTS